MNKLSKKFDDIKIMVSDLPNDYQREKEKIINSINIINDEKVLNDWLHTYIYGLPLNKKWKRRHVYLLLHDLLEFHHINSNLIEIIYDIESVIIGECSVHAISKYENEPDDPEELLKYIRSYDWLIP